MSSSIEYQLMGAKNGNKDKTVKGKDVAAVHLNTFCINKKFIGIGQSFRDVDPVRAKDVSFYKEFGGYIIQVTYEKKSQVSGVIEQKFFSPYTALQYYSSGKELMKEAFKNVANKDFWALESYQRGDPYLPAGEYWSTPIRDHMMKVLVDRTQKAGDKLLDKSLPFGSKEKFDISHAYLHGRDPSSPRNRALFNFMNQACGRYINNQKTKICLP